jgi:hypothetical protein
MAGVDSAGLGEVLQTVLASFSQADRGRLVQARATLSLFFQRRGADYVAERLPHRLARANARPRRPSTRDATTDPPARDAAQHRARGGPVNRRMARYGGVRADG